jgi:drug/metabolite transporter (DMT)-like permease
MKPVHLILLLVMNFFWAAVYSAYKLIALDSPGVGTGAIVTLRFGIAGLCLLAAWPWLPGPAPRRGDLAMSCLMGLVLCVVGQRLQVYGNQLGTAANSSVLMSFEPLLTSVAAAIFLRESIGPRRLAGFALSLLGVALLNGVWRSDFQWTGLTASLVFISSFIGEAAYSVMGKPIVARASPVKMVAITLLVGSAANLLIDGRGTFVAAKALGPKSWCLLAGLAIICTAIGYVLWFVVVRDCPVNVAALTIFAQSVFGVAIAALWLGEKLRWEHLFGSLAIVCGVMVGLSRQVKRVPVLAAP